jgi:5-formyltetrahydrofolate cyclo-ligase
MFEHADAAADRLAHLPEWQAARTVKVNPDWAQMIVRTRALEAGRSCTWRIQGLPGSTRFRT